MLGKRRPVRRMGQEKPGFPCRVDWGHPLARGLIACWVMNEQAGKTIHSIARRNEGTFQNETFWDRDEGGLALGFDGSNDRVDLEFTGDLPDAYPFSIFAIADLSRNSNANGTNGTIFAVSDFSSANDYYQLAFYKTGGNLGFRFVVRDTSSYYPAESVGYSLELHTVCGVAHSSTLRELYIDGVFVDNHTSSVTFPSGLDTCSMGILGRSSAWTTDLLPGNFNTVSVWKDRALTAKEIFNLNQSPYQFLIHGAKF